MANRLALLSGIGLTSDSGTNRMGFSKEERCAKDQVIEWMEEAGLTVQEDGAGNVIGTLYGDDQQHVIMAGSHVDSVPNGGHFDGPLGVLCALEIVEAWKETGYKPQKTYEVVIFSDEEGSRFKSGLTGSTAMTGNADEVKLRSVKDVNGQAFGDVLQNVGLNADGFFRAKRDLNRVEVFYEVHIEQGKRLEQNNLPVGIVTGIAGPCWLEISFKGKAGHAGNTPMNDRQDPLVAAGDFTRQIPKLPREVSESAVATVGQLHVYPNGINVIPGEVVMTVDIRDIKKESRDFLVSKVKKLAENISEQHGVKLSFQEKVRIPPVPIKNSVLMTVEKAVKLEHIHPFYLPSGAGHDAMMMGRQVPVGMIFVRSKDGISHHPDEWSSLNDCVQAVHVLKKSVEATMERGV